MAAKPPQIEPGGAMPAWTEVRHALGRRRLWSGRRGGMVMALIVVVVAAIAVARFEAPQQQFTGEGRAADGDSLAIGDDRIRLIGLDAPELDQECRRADGASWPCGREARDVMASLLADGEIECATAGADQFGRFLATCSIAGRDLGSEMVRAGFALSRDDYPAEESAARSARRGIWNGTFEDPRAWRDAHQRQGSGVGFFDDVLRWFQS